MAAHCGRHPDVVAVALCARCGGYVCGACTEVVWEMAYCAPCAERHQRDTRPSPAVRLALGANLLGLLCAPVVPLLSVSRQIAPPLLLTWTFAAAVAGTVISTWKIRRHTELGDQGFAIVLRVLSALSLLGHLLVLGAFMALGRHGR
ncbi:hypothetical protein [Corallococcus sp. EGB]|uniref:hypothetical protein n=1 Tax=Corallococcus sp. EGB TaxID=1521117 RepID=UPI001CBD44C6|nr:hypothetical protein [Corallococcus sp. EGB]